MKRPVNDQGTPFLCAMNGRINDERICARCRGLEKTRELQATRLVGVVGTILTSAVGAVRRAVNVSKRSAAAAAAPHNSRARSACRWYAWLLVNPTRSRSATIRVRCGEGAALVSALVAPAEKLHQVMHAHYLLVLGVLPAASTHRTPLLHAVLHAARFHGTDSGRPLSVRVSSAAGLFW